MNYKSVICGLALAAIGASGANATAGYADIVYDYFDSGAGPMAGPYGGTWNTVTLTGSYPHSVPTSVVLGSDGAIADFLSLPSGSYVTVGFTDEAVFDSAGNDIFVQEVAASGERANVFVSSDNLNFTFLGVAGDGGITSFDLADIGYTGQVTSVRIVGLDALGGSPGFDVVNIQALAFVPPTPDVPEPATWAMFIGGFGLIGGSLRKRRTTNDGVLNRSELIA